MTDRFEALRLEAETLSGLMVQLAENDIDSDSFAVMSDLGENGTEHECDLPITETALRASSVIDQLLTELEETRSTLKSVTECWNDEYQRNKRLQRPAVTQQGMEIITEAIGAHGFIVASIVQGRTDLALEESRKWVAAFSQAAEQVEGELNVKASCRSKDS
ncbi:hypothetical protein [Serratia fonticola]|uniref:hypothetical protein n=1 Tax=Serratia fonticola TaxID=47917 RepID=UPI0021773826|nr:hypothetical protein [Serratia fonticola]CAI1009666.1 Uncharacterised protein [Serratia fonticola]